MIDAAARPDLCGGIEQLARAMQDNHTAIDWNKLDRYLVEWGGGSVAKRLGYLAEALAFIQIKINFREQNWPVTHWRKSWLKNFAL